MISVFLFLYTVGNSLQRSDCVVKKLGWVLEIKRGDTLEMCVSPVWVVKFYCAVMHLGCILLVTRCGVKPLRAANKSSW